MLDFTYNIHKITPNFTYTAFYYYLDIIDFYIINIESLYAN